jgi:hypothetical protein
MGSIRGVSSMAVAIRRRGGWGEGCEDAPEAAARGNLGGLPHLLYQSYPARCPRSGGPPLLEARSEGLTKFSNLSLIHKNSTVYSRTSISGTALGGRKPICGRVPFCVLTHITSKLCQCVAGFSFMRELYAFLFPSRLSKSECRFVGDQCTTCRNDVIRQRMYIVKSSFLPKQTNKSSTGVLPSLYVACPITNGRRIDHGVRTRIINLFLTRGSVNRTLEP